MYTSMATVEQQKLNFKKIQLQKRLTEEVAKQQREQAEAEAEAQAAVAGGTEQFDPPSVYVPPPPPPVGVDAAPTSLLAAP